MRATPVALRQRIVAARFFDGQSMGEIALRFKIPKGTVQNVLERYRDTGSVALKPHNAGRKPAFAGPALARLEKEVQRHPDATLAELRDRSGLEVSLVAVHNTLKRLGFSRNKKRYVRESSSART